MYRRWSIKILDVMIEWCWSCHSINSDQDTMTTDLKIKYHPPCSAQRMSSDRKCQSRGNIIYYAYSSLY